MSKASHGATQPYPAANDMSHANSENHSKSNRKQRLKTPSSDELLSDCHAKNRFSALKRAFSY